MLHGGYVRAKFTREPGGNSAISKKKKEVFRTCVQNKGASFLPSQLLFPSIVLRVLGNDAAKGKP